MVTQSALPGHLLLVDDSDSDACLFRLVAGEVMPEVTIARLADGSAVIPHLERGGELPALIVLDLEMPGMHGLEVLSALGMDPRWREIPVVIWSSSDRAQDVRRAHELGARLFLFKGSDLHEVFACAGALAPLIGAPAPQAPRSFSSAW